MTRRFCIVVFAVLPLVYVAGCTSLEDSLLFHPVATSPADWHAPLPPLQDLELRTADGNKIHARWCPHPNARGAVLYCPGNAGNLEGRTSAIRELCQALGESVLIFDYPGYGRSDGKPSEASCCAAADAACRWLVESKHIAADRIILYGESLGGGVAVEQASRGPHRALVLVRTFASIPAVAQAHFSTIAVLATNRFDNIARLGQCKQPAFIAQADKDRIIPFEHGERLRAACAGPTEFHRLRDLDHNDPLPESFYASLRQFLRTRAPVAGP
jgi:pimeloyl-ACP methyl ester carboxylesterase